MSGLPPRIDCKGCGAGIRMVPLAAGGVMPVDIAPDPDGPVWLRRDGGRWFARVLAAGGEQPARSSPRFRPHWATCPQADELRSRGPRTPAATPEIPAALQGLAEPVVAAAAPANSTAHGPCQGCHALYPYPADPACPEVPDRSRPHVLYGPNASPLCDLCRALPPADRAGRLKPQQ